MNNMDLDVTDLVSPIYLKRLKNELEHLMKDLEKCGIFGLQKVFDTVPHRRLISKLEPTV